MATFMAAVESTIVATAMPTIVADLGGFSLFSWVFAVYLLTQAVSIPVYGRLADVYGRKRVFYAGAGLFLVGSTLCGFSQSMVSLILFRALQGFGAGGVQPIAATILGDIYTPTERAHVQGLVSSVFGVAAVLGPSLGAFLVEQVSWQLVFWVNLPIGVAAIAMVAAFLREEVEPRHRRIDYLGSLLLMVAITALMLVLVQGGTLPRIAAVGVAIVGIVALVVLVLHESNIPEPMLPVELWRSRIILVGSLGGAVIAAVMTGVSAFLPTYVQGAMGRSPTTTGIVIAVLSVIWATASIVAGRLMVRTSYRLTGAIGAIALMLGCAILIALDESNSLTLVNFGAALIGVGMGFCNTTFLVSVQAS
ncbi:MAG TPA: MFS transporter, partial [Acetobacteraceae bacterium]|nr:MFS transporter [Acetobacteraceae bacterium]